jgi:glycosyltransferase involved in cell wall biosynthesis
MSNRGDGVETTPVSVVLATYNGERFLRDQLDSLAAQSSPPGELIVADDASEDRTADLVAAFARRAPFPVRLLTGADRLGTSGNFERGLRAAHCDIVALCDQDDVWEPAKLSALSREFSGDVNAVASDAALIDEEGRTLPGTLWARSGLDRSLPLRPPRSTTLRLLLRENHIAGATALVRREIVQRALPIPPGAVHDYWLLLHAALSGTIVFDRRPLVRYRQHEASQIGARPGVARRIRGWSTSARVWDEAVMFRALHDRLAGAPWVDAADRALIERKLRHVEAREAVRSRPRWQRWSACSALLHGDYHRYSRGWGSFMIDLVGTPAS